MSLLTPAATCEIIGQLLLDLNQVTEPRLQKAWPVYLAAMPDGDRIRDDVLCVYDTTATLDGRLLEEGTVIEHPGWQVRVRGSKFRIARAKIVAVVKALDEYRGGNVVVEGVKYNIQNISRRSSILPLGLEENDRKRRSTFTVNGIITVSTV